ncbi:MAG TPA: hypothetical protein DEG17_18205 [Cyanobacteria bacterium UBA11149]|nr:hypothetical protein [Cyanobacteria bacterium UBA11367]HBE59494.1 hypothetical protein [Cyanobacteria bacterium UBA11366]HBK66872.1 hypothetical protein [Cyanobacteria bacterium UBA11166]HBR76841.1 hypothetical protein [Cyanobacteria bacterium UBA11159]HBS72598.1 hypothetical protein [Cyanobacteria bacterium UBA11153]HBW90752.1 hypothetical protein [Cyanobacteria bacterium UBA11149]HCA93681.1 hypothetical protein [Cyanobacteria bacterium UBA9226]
MDFQEIKTQDYTIQYNPESVTFTFQGELSLGGPAEYEPIAKLLEDVANQQPPSITLNLKKLAFLNSSGISLLSKFAIGVRKRKTIKVLIQGSSDIPWQEKSLANLEKLLPSLKLELH